VSVRFVERLVFLLLVTGVFAWVMVTSTGFPRLSRIFPNTVATAALVLCVAELIRMLVHRLVLARRRPPDEAADEGPSLIEQAGKAATYIAWIVGYYVGIYVLGFVVASALFVAAFITVLGGVRPFVAVLGTAALITFLLVFGGALNLHWPQGLIDGWLGIDLP
jgi:putative tricarboxylic transport membrane protein